MKSETNLIESNRFAFSTTLSTMKLHLQTIIFKQDYRSKLRHIFPILQSYCTIGCFKKILFFRVFIRPQIKLRDLYCINLQKKCLLNYCFFSMMAPKQIRRTPFFFVTMSWKTVVTVSKDVK